MKGVSDLSGVLRVEVTGFLLYFKYLVCDYLCLGFYYIFYWFFDLLITWNNGI